MAKPVVILAAGGTGGHIFPALSVGEVLIEAGWRPVFITDARGRHMIPDGYSCVTISAASPFASSLWLRGWRLMRLGLGLIMSALTILLRRPKAVIGFGGYPAVAPVLAARGFRLPVMLHEQNASMGRANRFLAKRAKMLATSWPVTKGIDNEKTAKIVVTGTPVRAAFHQIGQEGYNPPQENGPVRLLIVGGSLGASIFGDTVPEAISRLPEDLKKRLKLVHQVRAEQTEAVRERYQKNGIDAVITTFIKDMAKEMRQAHLVICRAGASSVAELAAAGRPALLVPYPNAMDDHQTANAQVIHDIGGGWLTPEAEMSAGSLAGKIATLTSDPARLTIAATNALQLAKPEAAHELAELVMTIAERRAAL
jgi:UDP-N-acetylglucosamine--N-acetylmuramyl-(pentapeptide) pyrophosphoryl-undecaprenol N-acetylglucosamine transferase